MSSSALRLQRHPLLALALALVVAPACGLPHGEELVAGPPLAREIRRSLEVPLKETPPVDSTSVMANVDRTYSGRSAHERLLVVVFDSSAATVQLTRRHRPADKNVDVLVRRNAVVLYEHESGTPSRLAKLRAALDRAESAG